MWNEPTDTDKLVAAQLTDTFIRVNAEPSKETSLTQLRETYRLILKYVVEEHNK